MSGVVKAVKKVFRRVVKVVKKVAPIVLAAGALIFTGGAALGLTGVMGGGWTAAAGMVSNALGATGTLGSALTGAITQAGYGALAGGAIAEISGGSFSEGARSGAIVGAATGGLMGAIKGPAPGGSGPVDIDAATGEAIPRPSSVQTNPYPAPAEGPAMAGATPGAAPPTPAGAPPTPAPVPGGSSQGLMSGAKKAFAEGGWIERNQELVGGAVKGLGQGLMAGAAADAEIDALRERQGLISQNYAGTDPGARYRSAAPQQGGQTPANRFDPSRYGSFEYQFNPQTGRIERVPVGG